MKNVATFKNEMSTVDSGEGNFDFSNLVVIVKVKLFLGVGHKSTSRLYSVIFGSSLRGPTQKLAESQLTLMCKLGWGPNIKKLEHQFIQTMQVGVGPNIKKYFSLEISISYT